MRTYNVWFMDKSECRQFDGTEASARDEAAQYFEERYGAMGWMPSHWIETTLYGYHPQVGSVVVATIERVKEK